jgi:hypothetical protein
MARAPPLAKKTASLIGKETNERPTSNIERPTSNNVFCQFKYKTDQACSAKVAKRAGSESVLLIFAVSWL